MKTVLSALALAISLLAAALAIALVREMPRHVSLGDHALRMSVRGEGAPAVVFESFGPAPLETWSRVQADVSRFTTTVTYDHAGYGGSTPGPGPRDGAQIARELRAALSKVGVRPPYVLVGYSFGGPYVRIHAGQSPRDIAGLVLVDPTQEDFMAWLSGTFPELTAIPARARTPMSERGCQWETLAQARTSTMPNVPITLLTGMRSHDLLSQHLLPKWLEAHRAWLKPFPRATHLVTTNSGHAIPLTEPGLISGAILRMVRDLREQ